jgi:hypothetical protein
MKSHKLPLRAPAPRLSTELIVIIVASAGHCSFLLVKAGLAAGNAGVGFSAAAHHGLKLADASLNLSNDLLSTAKDALDD